MRPTSLTSCAALVAFALCATVASAQSPTSLFFDDFTAPAAWTADGIWGTGGATASSGHTTSCGNADPAFDADGAPGGGIAGTDIGGNAGTSLIGKQYFTSPVIPCSGPTGLAFDRWLNSDYTPFMQNGIDVWDGSAWVEIWSTGGPPNIEDAWWRPQFFDVSAHANAAFQVRFWYLIGSTGVYTCSGWNLDNVDVFDLVPGSGPIALRSDDFTVDQGWTLTPDWMIGAAAASTGSFYNDDPAFDADGNIGGNVLGVVLGGLAPTTINGRQYATSPVYDTSGVPNLGFSFERWLNADYLPYAQHGIDVFDGTNWNTIWTSHDSPGPQDDAWRYVVYDASDYANAAFQVRFWYEVLTSAVIAFSSWNIDNFELFTSISPHGQAGDRAVLDVNGSALNQFGGAPASQQPGLYFVDVFPGSMAVELEGDDDINVQPWVLLGGLPNVGATSVAPYGQLDLGGAGFAGLEVLGSGLDAGFHNLFFVTDFDGDSAITYVVPPSLSGFDYGLQAVVLDPFVTLSVTNAVVVTFN